MGKYQTYPEYKNSGVEWLDNIPEHWNIAPIKRVASFITGMTPSTSVSEYYSDEETDFEWIRPEDIKETNESVSSSKFLTRLGWNTQRVVPAHSSLICCIGTIGKIGYVLKPVTTNQQITSATFYFSSKYYFYVLLAARTELEIMSAGNVVRILNTDRLGRINVPLIMEPEALTIANFLDHETAKIDALIEKQQQLISLLQEKRQAVISHAVTKGLSPDVPMKDSGVEWLGQVPEHWVVKRLKHISPKIGVGLVINPSTYTKDEGTYFIFGGDVKEYGFDLTKTRKISQRDSDQLKSSQLSYRDLVSVRVGYPGITAVVPENLDGSNCASIIIIRRGNFDSDWLCAAMNTWIGRQQVNLVSYGAAQKQFNVSDAVEFIFPVPPDKEQTMIASFVQSALERFSMLTGKAQQQIELLKERRAALISAAVTGKIDVRNWQAPSQSPSTSTEEQAL
nr:restriction endonuclease subunit S [Plesiomonas shigelloides]